MIINCLLVLLTQGKPFEGMNELLTPSKLLLEAEVKRSDKSTSEGIFSDALRMSKGKENGCGNTSTIYVDNANALGSTPPSVQGKARRGRPRKASVPEEPSIPPQVVIDAARSQNMKRVNPIWIRLVSADKQLGPFTCYSI